MGHIQNAKLHQVAGSEFGVNRKVEQCQIASAMPQSKALRLIALTGYGQTEDRQRTRTACFDAHPVKPVTLAALE